MDCDVQTGSHPTTALIRRLAQGVDGGPPAIASLNGSAASRRSQNAVARILRNPEAITRRQGEVTTGISGRRQSLELLPDRCKLARLVDLVFLEKVFDRIKELRGGQDRVASGDRQQ